VERLPQETELLSASFPCVDVSHAGARAGINGLSTGLVRHVFRLLGDPYGPRVPWVLLENVPGLLDRSSDGQPAVAYVVDELERLGYSWAHRVVSAAAFGIPQRRRRVFIVASLHGDPRDVLLAPNYTCLGGCSQAFGAPCAECGLRAPAPTLPAPEAPAPEVSEAPEAPEPAAEEEGAEVPAPVTEEEADAEAGAPVAVVDAAGDALEATIRFGIAADLSNAQNSPSIGITPTFTTGNCRMSVLLPSGAFGLLRIQDAERLQGLPVDWTDAASVCASRAVSHSREGAERRFEVALRWGLVGNAVCVPVARWLGERLRNPYSTCKYVPRDAAPEFAQRVPDTWPRAAWCLRGGARHRDAAGEQPQYCPFTPLGDFVRDVGAPPSHEATSVWAARMRSAGWMLNGPLKRAVEALLARGGGAGRSLALPRRAPGAEDLEKSVFLRDPSQRRQVWAKYAAFPWWPGLVVDVERDWVPEAALRSPARGEDTPLVVFFGDATWQWVRPEYVRDFGQHYAEHAAAVVRGSRQLFQAAVAEAKDMLDRRTAAVASGAALTLAQPGAGEAAPPPAQPSRRCGACRTCKAAGAHRPCLMGDAMRLAAVGHAGAAVTARGATANGLRLEIYWPLDERFYSGVVTDFDPHSCCHRVLYDDDESELVALWKETVGCTQVPAKGAAPAPRISTPVPPAPPALTAAASAPTPAPEVPTPEAPPPPAAATARAPGRARTLSSRAADAATSALSARAEEGGEESAVKRRRGDRNVVNYASFFHPGRLPGPRSHRCAVCRTQKKGQCGTPTSSGLCLKRTADMPLRRQVVPNQRRGGRHGGSLPILPADQMFPEEEEVEVEVEPARTVP